MSNLSTLNTTVSISVSCRPSSTPAPATAPSNLSLDLLIQYIDNVLSAIINKDLGCQVFECGTKLRDLAQPIASDISKLLEGISQGAKTISDQKLLTSRLSTEAQTLALDILRGVGNAHWAAVGLLVIANVLERFDKISANDRECLDLLKVMLNLAKYMKQLKDNHFDLHREILEKMSEAVQLIVVGSMLCHSFIGSNKISKFLLTSKIREELVYVRGKVDGMKSDLVLQMQVLIMSTLTFYISRHHDQPDMLSQHVPYHTGGIDDINCPTITEQLPWQQSNDALCDMEQSCKTEICRSESENRSCKRGENSNKINEYQQPKKPLSTFLNPARFLKKITPDIFGRRPRVSPSTKFEIFLKKIPPSAIQFTHKELLKATKGFGEKLGSGGFGIVYFGALSDGRKVAVKEICVYTRQAKKEWKQELEIATKIEHPNIMTLVGYCLKDHLALVFEYMAGGDLQHLLFGRGERNQILDWPTRLKIILDTIRGLVYLDERCIVHTDIKPSNILLDENFNAKIADFGLSRRLADGTEYIQTWTEGGVSPTQGKTLTYDEDCTHVTTVVSGTMGYIDPEYVRTSCLTKKSDIYNFGILLLNVVSGKQCVGQTEEGFDFLHEHAWTLQKGDRLNELIDPRLFSTQGFDSSSILRIITIALWCIQIESERRPSASQVLAMLSSEDEIPAPLVESLYFVDGQTSSDNNWSTTSMETEEDDYLSALEEDAGEIEDPAPQL